MIPEHDASSAAEADVNDGPPDNYLGVDKTTVCTLGQITEAFFEVGGQYRRNV